MSFLLMTAITAPAYAGVTEASTDQIDMSKLVCPDLADEASYKKKSLDHYAVLMPGKDGWVFRTSNDFRPKWDITKQTLADLQALQKAFKDNNMELVLVIPPVKGMTAPDKIEQADKTKFDIQNVASHWKSYEKMISDLNRAGVNAVGMTSNSTPEDFFYRRNHHWSAEGAMLMAKEASETVKKLPFYKDVLKKEYVSTVVEKDEYKSSFERAFRQICGTNVPPEQINIYKTTPSKNASTADDLFGDAASDAKIVLLGTSNSINDASKSNFEGFLNEYLSADVENLAVVGAGVDTSILAFLNSKLARDGKKKIVIWEIPGYYDLNSMDEKIYSQAIPAAYSGCKNPLAKTALEPDTGKMNYIFRFNNPGGEETADKGLPVSLPALNGSEYLHVHFDKPVKSRFTVNFLYKDDTNYKHVFIRDSRYQPDGDFYVRLPATKDNTKLKRIAIYTKKSVPEGDFMLCRTSAEPPAQTSMK